MREVTVRDLYSNSLAEEYPEFDQYDTTEEITDIIFGVLNDALGEGPALMHAWHAVLLYGEMRFKEGELARYFPGHYEDAWDEDALEGLSYFMEENAFLDYEEETTCQD